MGFVKRALEIPEGAPDATAWGSVLAIGRHRLLWDNNGLPCVEWTEPGYFGNRQVWIELPAGEAPLWVVTVPPAWGGFLQFAVSLLLMLALWIGLMACAGAVMGWDHVPGALAVLFFLVGLFLGPAAASAFIGLLRRRRRREVIRRPWGALEGFRLSDETAETGHPGRRDEKGNVDAPKLWMEALFGSEYRPVRLVHSEIGRLDAVDLHRVLHREFIERRGAYLERLHLEAIGGGAAEARPREL